MTDKDNEIKVVDSKVHDKDDYVIENQEDFNVDISDDIFNIKLDRKQKKVVQKIEKTVVTISQSIEKGLSKYGDKLDEIKRKYRQEGHLLTK